MIESIEGPSLATASGARDEPDMPARDLPWDELSHGPSLVNASGSASVDRSRRSILAGRDDARLGNGILTVGVGLHRSGRVHGELVRARSVLFL